MVKRIGFIFMTVFIVFVLNVVINFASPSKNKLQQENHAPVVKIISPKNNSVFDWNIQFNYSISVSDKEDGESKYDEINTKEVLLEVKYIADESKITDELNKAVQSDPPGLAVIRTSNCFNCHAFNAKSVGPSFYDINKKYPATTSNIALLVKNIREGSTGVWGKVSMPTHPELTKEETQDIVQWMFQNAADTSTNYFIGTEGSFRIKPPAGSQQKATYMLTASYPDHGVNDASKQHLKGQDIIIIHSR
ncbi:MAG: c-type cytochrome [Ginsengibacter sp.]